MDSDLNLESKYYDVIIMGTGLTECILSSALARIGKSVLHLDENRYYGSQCSSLSLDSLNELLSSSQTRIENYNSTLKDGFEWKSSTEVKGESLKGNLSIRNVAIFKPNSSTDLLADASFCRRCSIDISPKLIWSRSLVIDTLIRAGVSRYLEFKTIQHIYMHSQNRLVQVPVSKADVFNTTNISLIEKRLLMKFITTVSQPDETESALIKEMTSAPFTEYLKKKKLTDNLISFILYAIAIEAHPSDSTQSLDTGKGVDAIVRFLSSVGRYGSNSPWIYPLFGSGDLTQAFCRLSAVYGTTFILGNYATVVNVQTEGELKVTGIEVGATAGIICKHLVSNFDHLPELAQVSPGPITSQSRCVLITDKALLAKEPSSEITFTVIPPNTFGNPTACYILQLNESASVVAAKHHLLHIWTEGTAKGAESDLKAVVTALTSDATSSESDNRPNSLYCAYFSIVNRTAKPNVQIPSNLLMLPDIEQEIGADPYFVRAKELFERICPGEEFIPHVPNPDDIIWAGDEDEAPSSAEAVPEEPRESNEPAPEPLSESTADPSFLD